MADQNVNIGIRTTADTSGVNQTQQALTGLGDTAQTAAAGVQGTGAALAGTAAAANRTRDGVREVATETRQLGRRNSGAAVLELSRGFEDAQYGIRGVLNNLPGLVLALGGTAGLAGAISLVAVAGSVLWTQFGSGADKAKKDTKGVADAVKGLLDVYQSFIDAGKDARDEATEGAADTLKNSLSGLDQKFNITVQTDTIADAYALAEASIQLARDKVALAENERKLAISTGEESVRLAKEREVIVQRIRDDEEAITEVGRTAALNKAKAEVSKARGEALAAATAGNTAFDATATQAAIVKNLEYEADSIIGGRLMYEERLTIENRALGGKIEELTESLNALDRGPTGVPGVTNNAAEAVSLKKQIAAAEARRVSNDGELRNPSTQATERDLTTQANRQAELLKTLSAESKTAADAQKSAAAALEKATLALSTLKGTQRAQTITGKGTAAAEELGEAQEKGKKAGKVTAEKIKTSMIDVIEGLGDKVNDPAIKKKIAKIEELAQDGIQAAEESEVTQLVGTLVSQMKTSYGVSSKAFRDIIQEVGASVVEQTKIAITITALSKTVQDLQREVSRMPH